CRASIRIDARLEGQEAIDRVKLQPGIGDEHEVSRGDDGQPGREPLAAPEMQEDRDEEHLLRDAQTQLDEIRRPALNKAAKPAMTPEVGRPQVSARIGFVLQGLPLSTGAS